MVVPPPSFVLETALYASDLEAAEWFYSDVLRLEVLFREEDRHVFFRCGTGVILLFRPEVTRQGRNVPPHGTDGDGHVAFAVPADRLEAWRAHLADHGVEVEQEKDWGERGQSLYVRDPAGNSVELAAPTLWGTASRDDRLRHCRPQPELPPDQEGPVDLFCREILRPVFDLLTPTLVRLVAQRLDLQTDGEAIEAKEDLQGRLRSLLEEDEMLRQRLFGALLGHFTEEELTEYQAHQVEIQHRFFVMVHDRVREQVDVIVEHVEE